MPGIEEVAGGGRVADQLGLMRPWASRWLGDMSSCGEPRECEAWAVGNVQVKSVPKNPERILGVLSVESCDPTAGVWKRARRRSARPDPDMPQRPMTNGETFD